MDDLGHVCEPRVVIVQVMTERLFQGFFQFAQVPDGYRVFY